MKVTMKLTMDGLLRTLRALADQMAEEAATGYADGGGRAARGRAAERRDNSRTDRDELGSD